MQSNKMISTAVGLFVLLALGGLFFLGFKATSLGSFRPDGVYQVRALFGDVSGLGKDAQVSLAGVQIGRVAAVQLGEGMREAVVLLNIDRRVPLPADSSAQILTAGLLGERYIGITPGSSQSLLQDGATLARTGGSLVLEKALGQFLGGGGGFYPDAAYQLSARFNDISGLTVDTPVRQSGVQIGRVSAIALDQNTFQAVVTLEIAAEYNQIPLDSSADIVSSSLLGGKYIAVTPGGDTAVLEDGGEFQYTNSSIVLERVIQQLITNMTMQQ